MSSPVLARAKSASVHSGLSLSIAVSIFRGIKCGCGFRQPSPNGQPATS
jgi:hypothetical protein